MKYSGIGGQAVIEGIMMKNQDNYATAVRRPDGSIEVKKDTYVSMTEKVKFFALPFVRGVFSFADSMILGMRSLTWSASFFEDDEDEEPGKLEKFLTDRFGEKLEAALMTAVMVFSILMAIVIFMVLPLVIANFFRRFIASETVMAVLEGLIRIMIFIGYIKLISGMEDIRRTFMYHGSEHKCINCLENGLVLNVENVRNSSKEHKLRNQLPFVRHGNQHPVFHGGSRGHGMASDYKQDYPDSCHRRRLLRGASPGRPQQFQNHEHRKPPGHVDAGAYDEGTGRFHDRGGHRRRGGGFRLEILSGGKFPGKISGGVF